MITKKKNSRKIQAETTKNKLLQVSLDLIKEQGFDNVKIEDICSISGVSTGAFYHHFKSKSDIVTEVYTDCDAYFESAIFPLFKNPTTIDAIPDYISYQAQYAEDVGVDICTQFYKAQLTEGRDYFLSMNRPIIRGLNDIILELQEKKLMNNNISPLELTKEIFIISRGILYNWAQNNGNFKIVDLTKKMVSTYIQAYLPK